MRLTTTSVALLLALVLAVPASSQTVTDQRVWTAIAAQGRLGTRSPWRWSSDFMIRARDGARTMDFVAGRVMTSRDLTRRSSAGVGYAYGEGFPDGHDTYGEHRPFQQYVWSVGAAGRGLSLRSRLEERFIEGNDGVLLRMRQQARVSVPLSPSRRLQFVTWEEAFVNVNSTEGMGRNRRCPKVDSRLSLASVS